MPEFKKSKGFTMKGPTFFGSALKKYRKAPLKHDGSTPAGDMRHDHTPGDAGQAEEKKPMTSPQVEERETQPGDAGQMKMPESPTKGLKDILGKAKDKLSGGVGAGAGIGMMLGGPLGAAIGGGIGAIRKKRQAKKAAAAEQPGAAPAGVPGAGAGSPEPVPSPMGKRGKKRKAKKHAKKLAKATKAAMQEGATEAAAAMTSGALMSGAMRVPTKKSPAKIDKKALQDKVDKVKKKKSSKLGKATGHAVKMSQGIAHQKKHQPALYEVMKDKKVSKMGGKDLRPDMPRGY